jgi:NAD(P)-dependent dehydrogenase (short-subunit alcohol dehydrogenase family)
LTAGVGPPLLHGLAAIVTGGGGGIGRGISEALATHGAGVVVVDRDAERAHHTVATITAGGGSAQAVVADVGDDGVAGQVVADAWDRYGRIDVVVNNVGHYLFPGRHFHDTTEDDWEALYRVNLLHVFRMCKAALPTMIDAGRGGSIITVSSVEAFRGIPGQPVYGAFKAAVAHFTRSLALDVAEYRIRVNDLAPDVTTTLQLPYDRWLSPEERLKIPAWVPLGRLGLPADAGGVAVFLASELSAFVTGTSIPVDGGTLAAGGWYRTAHGERRWTNRPRDA